ncbi:MAG: HEPN domain-containing protein [Bacteroidaceae bacterium]|nr:HEPN domain-containing protein [Bacteroidaceae bacterium]
MKHSISRLPKRTQRELNTLVELIKQNIPECRMIILFGSYARRNYVIWDERVEDGIRTVYQSDYDILIVVGASILRLIENRIQQNVIKRYYEIYEGERTTPPSIIVEHLLKLNEQLTKSQYFFTDIVKEGIMLYDDKTSKLAKPRNLSFPEIKEIARNEYEKYFHSGIVSIKMAEYAIGICEKKEASFQLHQACEKFYKTISAVYVNYVPREHNLKKLESAVKQNVIDVVKVFPRNDEFEKTSFELLCRAYIDARYSKSFDVSDKQLQYMLERTKILRDLTESVCRKQFTYYDTCISSGM